MATDISEKGLESIYLPAIIYVKKLSDSVGIEQIIVIFFAVTFFIAIFAV